MTGRTPPGLVTGRASAGTVRHGSELKRRAPARGARPWPGHGHRSGPLEEIEMTSLFIEPALLALAVRGRGER